MKNNKYILYVMLLLIPHEQFIASAGAGRSVALQGNEVAIESMAVDEKYLAPDADLVDDLKEFRGRCWENYFPLKLDPRESQDENVISLRFILRNWPIIIADNQLNEQDDAIYPNITATTYLNILVESSQSDKGNLRVIEFCIKKIADLTSAIEKIKTFNRGRSNSTDRHQRYLNDIEILLERGKAWQEARLNFVIF